MAGLSELQCDGNRPPLRPPSQLQLRLQRSGEASSVSKGTSIDGVSAPDQALHRDYLSLLHAGGFHEEAWSIFNTTDIESNSPDIWTAAFVGQRAEGKSGQEIAKWLAQDQFNGVSHKHLEAYLLGTLLIDRSPDPAAAELIAKTMRQLKKPPEEYTVAFYRPNLAVFADGFYLLRDNQPAKAREVLGKWVSQLGYTRADFAVPYLALSLAKSKDSRGLEELFQKLEEAGAVPTEDKMSQAYLHMAKAYAAGLLGKQPEALEELRLAKDCLPFTMNRPFSPWYQLVETCEWLYRETGSTQYRDLALAWAKVHQRIKPYFAWAYAVEAKYAPSGADRTRALAIALYLDRGSERISAFNEDDKARARKWLERFNPFVPREDSPAARVKSAI